MRIEVVYAHPKAQDSVELDLPDGADAAAAVAASGLAARYGLDASALKLGRFGDRIAGSTRLRAGDRIDILRPLAIDPKELRRQRARRARSR